MLGRGATVLVALVIVATGLFVAGAASADESTLTVCDSGCNHTSIQAAVDAADPDTTIQVQPGTYPESVHVDTENLTIEGTSPSEVTIDASGESGTRGVTAQASGFSLRNVTVVGPDDGSTSSTDYGVKVETTGEDLTDVKLSNLVVQASGQSEVDLHGVDGANLTNLELNGQNTSGNGLAFTDSHNVTVTNLTTANNRWGGVAFYTSGAFTGEALTSNISLEGDLSLQEANPVYLQGAEGTFGNVTTPGFHVLLEYGSQPEFTFRQPSVDSAVDNAVAFADGSDRFAADTATVRAESGAYHVGPGMSIQTGVDAAPAPPQPNATGNQSAENSTMEVGPSEGDVVLHPGTYTEQVVLDESQNLRGVFQVVTTGSSPTIQGPVIQAPSSLDTTANDRSYLVTVTGEDTNATIQSLELAGPATGLDGGIAVVNGADAKVRGNTITEVHDDPLSGAQRGVGVVVGRMWHDTQSTSTATAEITDNVIEDAQKSAVVVTGEDSFAEIDGNEIACSGNEADDTIAQDAIQLWQSSSANVTDNEITDCFQVVDGDRRGVGVHVSEGVHDTVVRNNTITGAQTGIMLLNFAPWSATNEQALNLTITDNDVSALDGGIYLVGSAENLTVTGNEVTDGQRFGILLGHPTWLAEDQPDFQNVSVEQNVLADNAVQVIDQNDAPLNMTAVFRSNSFDKSVLVRHGPAPEQKILTSIQQGIDLADPDDRVEVGPGEYEEALTIDKSLNLIGAQASEDANTRSGDETVVNGSIQVPASVEEVGIDGLTIQATPGGPLDGVALHVAAPQAVVGHNRISGASAAGGYTHSGIVTFEDTQQLIFRENTVTGTLDTERAPNGVRVLLTGTVDVHLEANSVSDAGAGGIGLSGGTGGEILLRDNALTQNRDGMFAFNSGAEIRLVNNTLTDNRANGANLAAGLTGAKTAHLNLFEDNEVGLRNNNTDPVDATHNWWGYPAGPSTPANPLNDLSVTRQPVEGPAEVTPWCVIRTCAANGNVHALNPHAGVP